MKKFLFNLAGGLALLLAIIGVFLPLLPTTPFLLLASACFMRGSPRFNEWLLSNPALGPYIRDFQEHRGLTKKVKARAIILLWLSLTVSAYVMPVPWARWFLLIPGIGVTVYLLRYKTKPEEN